jgi:hypothetical protein
MANNFAEAFLGARNLAQDRIRQQQEQAQASQMRQTEFEQAQQDRGQNQILGMARGWKTVQPQNRQAYYERFIKPAITQQFGDPGPYDEGAIDGIADQILAAYGSQGPSGAVQSTYVDAAGNRVAIMRDGTTAILGQNAPTMQIIEGEGGFYGVNKGNLRAAPVQLGGATSMPAGGMFQGPDGMPTRIDPSLPPAVQQAIMADPNAWATAPDGASAQLPTQQGQQLRPAPKEGSRETFSQPQAVTGPDGTVRYVQFGNQGSAREVQGYSAPPTDRDAKPPTEGERKAATLLQRLRGSLSQLQQAVREDPESASPSLAAEAARRLPFVGEAAGNTIMSPTRQRVEAAQLDILDAALTLGTGAAYTREQLEGYRRSYFPQIGDSEATIRDKAARLNNVIQAAEIAAGRANPENPERGGRYQIGQIIETGGKRYRITGLDDPNDPDVEEVR